MTFRMLWASFKLIILATLVIGLGYTFAMTGLAEALFPHQANGSLITYHGRTVGSSLVGQQFTSLKFFQGRPSATTPPYNAADSSPSNFGPTNPKLLEEIDSNLHRFLRENPGVKADQVPPAMVESSGSGLDPDIPVEGAILQAPRVARMNHLSIQEVDHLIHQHIHGRFLGIFGHSYVNVLKLNLALEQLKNDK
ncbi:MAG: potassium-transporting ATPase subunit KdpC [Actinobacteria bacterium]|nr:potassium-transporting ATPase subunit KdpC [Actinomycetota bacterium]MCL6094221.1 potassium-transporting ATPase subunit KdpC [Actinomycetota bacterium]